MSIAEAQVEAEIETFDDKDPWYSVALDLIKRKPVSYTHLRAHETR